MYMQMSPADNRLGGYLPDDCGECRVCSTPMMGSGMCPDCGAEFDQLESKLRGEDDS